MIIDTGRKAHRVTSHETLAQFVRVSVAFDGPCTEESVFGLRDPQIISALIIDALGAHMGQQVVEVTDYRASVGCVVIARMADHYDPVVLKILPAAFTDRYVRAMVSAIGVVRTHGVPAPEVIHGPFLVGQGQGLLYRWLDPEPISPAAQVGPAELSPVELSPVELSPVERSPVDMRTSAASLAEVLSALRTLDPEPFTAQPMQWHSRVPFARPHHPLFIGPVEHVQYPKVLDAANRAAHVRDQLAQGLPSVVGHGDWAARNVRWSGARLLAVYDWDSLDAAPIGFHVGRAATQWNRTGEVHDPPIPEPEALLDYLRAYENEAKCRLGKDQWNLGLAAALLAIAYTARCECVLAAYGTQPTPALDWIDRFGSTILRC